jgi:hypothetical protein
VSTVAGPSTWAPRIANTTIRDNTGPGLDIDSVWGGQLIGNTIVGNTSWAGISLFGSHWLIENSTVRHPATSQGQPYQRPCATGPSGERSAAIMLCQLNDPHNRVTTNNLVRGNAVSSWYGILLVGNDEGQPYWAPRTNGREQRRDRKRARMRGRLPSGAVVQRPEHVDGQQLRGDAEQRADVLLASSRGGGVRPMIMHACTACGDVARVLHRATSPLIVHA